MSNVIDLGAERARRRRDLAAAKANHPSSFRETDLQPFLDVIDRDIKELAALACLPDQLPARPGRRGAEPTWITVDEVHHWTEYNPAFGQLRRDWLKRLSRPDAFSPDATPERQAEVSRVLRILRSTDQGSNGGDAESHQGDDR